MRRPSSWSRFMRRALVLLIMLAAGGSGEARRLQEFQAEEEDIMKEGDDSACLKGLLDHTVRQQSSASIATTWTAAALASPCNYSRALTGISCNNSNSRVASISLPSANLAGTLPSSLSSCYFLHTLDLSSNSLTGALPPSLGALSLLSTLSLSNNQLSGPIPYELASCSSLSSLDLHRNQLTGSIPGQVGLLPLQKFDVSNNKLSGRIPSTLSNTSSGSPRFHASSFANNSNLYGFPLNPNPPSSSSYSPPPPNGRGGLSLFGILAIGLASGLASFIIVFFLVSLWLEVRERHIALLEAAEIEHKGNLKIDDSSSSEQQYIGWKEVLDRL